MSKLAILVMLLTSCGSPIEFPAPPAPPPPAPPVASPPPPAQVLAAPVLVAMPSNLTVSTGDQAVDSVELMWDLANSAQSYRVEWLSDPEDLSPLNGTASHGSLANDLRYIYTVRVGTQVAVLSAAPASADSTAPVRISITSGPADNTLSWEPVTGATGYQVYWSYEANVSPATGTHIAVGGGQTTYTHNDLDAGTHYYYVVTALLSDGTQGRASAEVGARPGQTVAVTATVSEGQVDLSWPSAVGDLVTVSTSQTFEVPSLPFPLDQNDEPTPVRVRRLENDTRYAFRVRPVFSEGAGPASTTVYATPRAGSVPPHVTLIAGRGVNTIKWKAVSDFTSYDVTWSAVDPNGNPILNGNGDRVEGSAPNITGTQFRHAALPVPPCPTPGPTCPTYVYVVKPSLNPSAAAPTVEAVSVDLRPVPPLVTNTNSVTLAGVKPSGSRVEIRGSDGAVIKTVPFDRETGWTATVPLDGPDDKTFIFRLVAIDDNGLTSTETLYQVTRDTGPPGAPTVRIDSCDPVATSPRKVTLSGGKAPGSAVFRRMEPNDLDRQIAGATVDTTWSGVLQIEGQTFELIAKDAAGNASAAVQVDLNNPTTGCP